MKWSPLSRFPGYESVMEAMPVTGPGGTKYALRSTALDFYFSCVISAMPACCGASFLHSFYCYSVGEYNDNGTYLVMTADITEQHEKVMREWIQDITRHFMTMLFYIVHTEPYRSQKYGSHKGYMRMEEILESMGTQIKKWTNPLHNSTLIMLSMNPHGKNYDA